MAFGQQSGPPASHSQLRELGELLERAGHSGFKDARGPMGFTQRQAAGKFTSGEADEFIGALQEAEHIAAQSPPQVREAPAPPSPTRTTSTGRPAGAPTRGLGEFSDQELAAELQRRGWAVMEP